MSKKHFGFCSELLPRLLGDGLVVSVWVTIRDHIVGVCLEDIKNPLSPSEALVPGILSEAPGTVWAVARSEAPVLCP